MFNKTADAIFNGVTEQTRIDNIFQDILSHNSKELAEGPMYAEGDMRRKNFYEFRRISEKRNNLLVFSTRAISAFESHGANRNGDAFERDELVKHHKSFFLKPHLMDHKMDIPFIRGLIADAHWNPKGDYVETLIFVDRDLFPKYASEIEKGVINSFSMGVQVDEAECSICGNKAFNQETLCEHAAHYKGLRIQGKQVFEYNRGLNFIEQSAVVSPADPESHIIKVLASVSNKQHPDMPKLKKLAELLDTYSADEKRTQMAEYLVIENATSTLADRIARDMGIDLRLLERGIK